MSPEFVCEGFHGADSVAGVVREGLIPGHLREGDRVSRLIKQRSWRPVGAVKGVRNSSAKVSTAQIALREACVKA